MVPEINILTTTRMEQSQTTSSDTTSASKQHLARVWYCKKCRNVSLGTTCQKCHSKTVQTEGTIEQYKQVGQALMDNRSEWREMLENMIIE